MWEVGHQDGVWKLGHQDGVWAVDYEGVWCNLHKIHHRNTVTRISQINKHNVHWLCLTKHFLRWFEDTIRQRDQITFIGNFETV